MSKRVHEIAKERGLPAKEVLEKLRAAGINVKAVSSSVDEDAAAKALGNGAPQPAGNAAPAANATASPPARKSDDAKGSGNTKGSGDAKVSGNAKGSGDAKRSGDAPKADKPRQAKSGDGKPADGARARSG